KARIRTTNQDKVGIVDHFSKSHPNLIKIMRCVSFMALLYANCLLHFLSLSWILVAGNVSNLFGSFHIHYSKNRLKYIPVCEASFSETCSGEPSATSVPPPSPPSGPISINQSAVLITSRLCSMTMTVLP
ncbi:MAG: hypothetical protein CG441_1101, partial [Methylococcaceae bacterium NSM2-1]